MTADAKWNHHGALDLKKCIINGRCCHYRNASDCNKAINVVNIAMSHLSAKLNIERSELYLVPAQSYEAQLKHGFKARKSSIPWPLALPIAWDADPYNDPNWRSKLLHWRMTDAILVEWYKKDDVRLLKEVFCYVADWHRFHFIERKTTPASWGDGGTGIRSLRIAFLWQSMKLGIFPNSGADRQIIEELAEAHLAKLLEPEFIAMNNHGIFQVFGCLHLAKALGNSVACQYAKEMFEALWDKQFDEYGVHKEHSPAYHFFALDLFERFRAGAHFDAPNIGAMLRRARIVGKHFIFPGGRLAHVGDSGGTTADVNQMIGKEDGDSKSIVSSELIESGYAAVRKSRSMLFVTAASHSKTHKHLDDLSFELMLKGEMLFIDSGKYGYFRDKSRQYVKSLEAHNTISVKGRKITVAESKAYGSGIKDCKREGDTVTIRGFITRSSIFSHDRTIVFNAERYIIIVDNLSSAEPCEFVSSFHLAPQLAPVLSGNGFSVKMKNSCSIAGIVFGAAKLDTVRGQKDPMLGWCSQKYGVIEPTSVIRATSSLTSSCTMTCVVSFRDEYYGEAISWALNRAERDKSADR
jgi:hypothetical protein